MQIGIFKCTSTMGQDLVHPLIQSTTVLRGTRVIIYGETDNQYITELHSSWMLVTSLISLTNLTHSGEEIVWVWLSRLNQYHSGCYFVSLTPKLVCNEPYVAHLHSFYVP